jgi:hypothetical protein
MALPLLVDDLDTVPEALRDNYKPADGGKFRLDLDGYEDPAGLKSALDKERRAAKDASKKASAWETLGKTPEEIQALLDAQAQAEHKRLSEAGEFDKLKSQMLEQHKSELAKKDSETKALRNRLEQHLVDAAGVAAISAADGSAELLLPHVKAKVKVIEEGGDYAVRVVDPSGNPRVNAQGEFLSIADLVSEMRQSDTFAPCFKAPSTTGGGAQQSNGQARGGPDLSKLSARERLNAVRANPRK